MNDTQTQWKFGEKGSAPLQTAGRRSFIVLMTFFTVVFIAAVAASVYEGWQLRQQALGDGRTVESYGFDLSNLNVSRDTLTTSGMLRDEQPVRDDPEVLTLAEVDEQSNYPVWPVVPDDAEVIGVVAGGEARAYPVRIMRGHEIVNDELGGEPIAVTYSPISDSVVVFDRRVGDDVLRFGYSGLVSNSNLIMYDRSPNEGEADAAAEGEGHVPSLWSQLQMRAISGPMAGQSASDAATLTVRPAWIGTWADWREKQQQTTVMAVDEDHEEAYVPEPWLRYYENGELRFPVYRTPKGERGLMDPVIVQGSPEDGWQVQEGATQPAEQAEAEAMEPTIRARWFAWYAVWGDAAAEGDE